jgi:hypothetical protein
MNSTQLLLLAYLICVCLLIAVFVYFKRKKSSESASIEEVEEAVQVENEENEEVQRRGARRAPRMRRRPVEEEEAESDEEPAPVQAPVARSAYELREEKRRAAREQREKERELAEQEAAEALAKLEQDKKEKEEQQFEEWKGEIEIDESGTLSADGEHSQEQQKLLELYEYINKNKMVSLDLLGGRLEWKASQVADKIQLLMETSKSQREIKQKDKGKNKGNSTSNQPTSPSADPCPITFHSSFDGIFDERGRFIQLEDEELIQLANYINQKGRIHVKEWVKEVNRVLGQTKRKLDQQRENEKTIENEQSDGNK